MTSSPRNTAPPSPVRPTVSSPRPPRSPSPASSELTATVVLPGATGEPPPSARKQDFQLEKADLADSNQGTETGICQPKGVGARHTKATLRFLHRLPISAVATSSTVKPRAARLSYSIHLIRILEPTQRDLNTSQSQLQ